MSPSFTDSLAGYDDVKEAPILESSGLPTSWYPTEVAAIQQKGVSKASVPWIKLQLKVFDGPLKGRSAYVMLSLTESRYKYVDNKEVERTDEEIAEAREKQQGRMKRILGSMGVHTSAPVGDGAEAVFNFYNVDGWIGRQMMTKLKLRETDGSNSISTCASLDDKTYGLSKYLAKLDKV